MTRELRRITLIVMPSLKHGVFLVSFCFCLQHHQRYEGILGYSSFLYHYQKHHHRINFILLFASFATFSSRAEALSPSVNVRQVTAVYEAALADLASV